MTRVLCAVDGFGSREAVGEAIRYCSAHAGQLGLVGVVRESRFDPPQPGGDYEKIRRYRTVEAALAEAAGLARVAGLDPTTTIRVGGPETEVLREARATGASQVFFAGKSGPAAILGGRRGVQQVALAEGEAEQPVRIAA